MDIYVVVGNDKAGKSSVIRSLTGCRISGVRRLKLKNCNDEVYVFLSSLQENGGNRYQPADFVQRVNGLQAEAHDKQKFNKIIFPLRFDEVGNYPSADKYLKHFQEVAGWNIIAVATLGNLGSGYNFQNAQELNIYTKALADDYPINSVSADVRAHFGW